MVRIFFLIGLVPTLCWATPEKIEFIFLSESQVSYVPYQPFVFSKLMAMNDHQFECVPMGDGCFHPQLGFVDEGPEKKEEEKPKLKTFNALETQLINCDKDYYFDIYCGKAKKIKPADYSGVEIWIDTSSSMKNVDYSADLEYCGRRAFIEKARQACGNISIDVSTFNTSRKQMGTLSDLCINYGQNNQQRLIDWIKGSNAKYLLVVTDIEEISEELRIFLEREGASIYGTGVKDFSVKALENYSQTIGQACKKI